MIGFELAILVAVLAVFLIISKRLLGKALTCALFIALLLGGGSIIYTAGCPECVSFIGGIKNWASTGVEVIENVPTITGKVVKEIQQDQQKRIGEQPQTVVGPATQPTQNLPSNQPSTQRPSPFQQDPNQRPRTFPVEPSPSLPGSPPPAFVQPEPIPSQPVQQPGCPPCRC